MFETITTEMRDGVLLITLNRPERLNAWTYKMGAELAAAVSAGNDDPEVLAMVVTGAGRGFCAGADIGDVFAEQDRGESEGSSPRDWVGLVRRSKPLVAAINGPAIGVGLTQVLPFDALYAAEGAKLLKSGAALILSIPRWYLEKYCRVDREPRAEQRGRGRCRVMHP